MGPTAKKNNKDQTQRSETLHYSKKEATKIILNVSWLLVLNDCNTTSIEVLEITPHVIRGSVCNRT
jgi:hypothetical protein